MKTLFIWLLVIVSTSGHETDEGAAPGPAEVSPRLFDTRIVGGTEAGPNEFPFQVSLQYFGSHFCGGSILDERNILTAAHCLDGKIVSSVTVVAGGLSLTSPEGHEQEIAASMLLMHERYNDDTLENDMALLQLESALSFNQFVQPVQIPSAGADTSGGTICTVTGWGTTIEDGSSPDLLQKVNVPVLSDEDCAGLYSGNNIKDSMICAGEAGKDSCQGDSGGPLICGGEQVGIVSWGYGCARPDFPGVYTQVSHFESWITSNKQPV